MARVFTLSSGSDGNCTFVGDAKSGILVDVGISFSRVKSGLSQYGMDFSNVEALVITHEHSDHIKGLSVFCKKTEIPVYATEKTVDYISKHHPDCRDRLHIIKTDVEEKLYFTSFTAFKVYHDSVDAVGYRIKTSDGRIVAYSTDIGHMDEEVFSHIEGADLNIIEANHDEGMLMCNPSYSYILKQRILGECGHLSNSDCAKTVAELCKKGNRRFVLAHLSDKNNTPDIAYEAVYQKLLTMGLRKDEDFTLMVAPRGENSRMLIF